MNSVKPSARKDDSDWLAVWERCKPARDDHPYLSKKGIKAHGIRQAEYHEHNCLVIPILNADDDLVGLQYISSRKFGDGSNKQFHLGSMKQHGYFRIGDDSAQPVLLVCEGYATGASLHEATGYPVFVAWDCHNLGNVTARLRKKNPAAAIIVCADNDAKREDGNIGLEKARTAAHAAQAQYVWPEGDGVKDFNDLYLAEGAEAVKARIAPKLEAALQNKTSWTAADLLGMRTRRIEWFVRGLLAPGVTLLGGGPKDGKSTLAMQIVAAIAKGEPVLGRQTTRSNVLYISWDEPDPRRLTVQLRPFLKPGIPFQVETDFRKFDSGGLEQLEKYLADNPLCNVVVLDTMTDFFGGRNVGQGYAKDMESMGALKRAIANAGRPVSVIVIHHTVKARRDRWENEFQFTNGITGGVQNMWMIRRVADAPDEGPYLFHIKGRGFAPKTLQLMRKFHYFPDLADDDDEEDTAHGFEWEVDETVVQQDAEQGHTAKLILKVLRKQEQPISQKRLMELLQDEGYAASRPNLSKQLDRLVEKGLVLNWGKSKNRPEYLVPENIPPRELVEMAKAAAARAKRVGLRGEVKVIADWWTKVR